HEPLLPTVAYKLAPPAVLVLALDVRGLVADAQVADREQLRVGLLRDRFAAGEFHLSVLLRGLPENRLGRPRRPCAILPEQGGEVLLAVEVRELAREVGPLPAQVYTL